MGLFDSASPSSRVSDILYNKSCLECDECDGIYSQQACHLAKAIKTIEHFSMITRIGFEWSGLDFHLRGYVFFFINGGKYLYIASLRSLILQLYLIFIMNL